MDARRNPYNPGSGLKPPALVGRAGELDAFDVLLDRTANELPGRGIILTGLRGVGKTVLLNEMRARAETAGWFVVGLEARRDNPGTVGIRRTLARELTARARALARDKLSARMRQALESVSAFNLKLGATGVDLGVEVRPGRADSGDVEIDLLELVEDLASALGEADRRFGLFIDEMQDLDDDLLSALLVAQHTAGQRDWPFYLIGAGLPHLPGVMAERRSYAERMFDIRSISRLAAPDAESALREPAAGQGVLFDDDALATTMAAAGGYPYFLQEFGRAAWEAAADSPITSADAQAGVVLGLERLDSGFFKARWDRATRSERRMLVAMADDGDGPSATGDVARRMTLKVTSLGPYRANLIAKGLIYAPEHGQLAYTVPGMADFVARNRENLDRA